MAKAIVNGPTRPMNIMMVIRILPHGLKSGVNPALIPTVPNADTVSNAMRCIPTPCSVIVSKKKITKMKIIPETAMDKALNTNELGILRLNRLISSLFEMTAHSVNIKTAKVVTLIPPPVEPEEAPINIRPIINTNELNVIWLISIVLNPAVRVTTP